MQSAILHFSVKAHGTHEDEPRYNCCAFPANALHWGTAVSLMTEKSELLTDEQAVDADLDLDEARLRQQAIGVKLRHIFDEVVNEPIPDEFLEILRRADRRTNEGGA